MAPARKKKSSCAGVQSKSVCEKKKACAWSSGAQRSFCRTKAKSRTLAVGDREQVFAGVAKRTSGGLTKQDLYRDTDGKLKSKRVRDTLRAKAKAKKPARKVRGAFPMSYIVARSEHRGGGCFKGVCNRSGNVTKTAKRINMELCRGKEIPVFKSNTHSNLACEYAQRRGGTFTRKVRKYKSKYECATPKEQGLGRTVGKSGDVRIIDGCRYVKMGAVWRHV